MRYIKKFESFSINEGIPGGIGAITGVHHKSKDATKEKASDKPDEFLCSALVNPIYNKWGEYNSKLVNCEFSVAKEKKGFFNKLFSDDTTLEFDLESDLLKQKIKMTFKLKKDKFVKTKYNGTDFVTGYICDEHIDKFIKYLLTQSKWTKELKEAIPDIETKFTKESFE